MISRTWHGIVPLKHKEGFTKYELISDPIVIIQEVTSDINPLE